MRDHKYDLATRETTLLNYISHLEISKMISRHNLNKNKNYCANAWYCYSHSEIMICKISAIHWGKNRARTYGIWILFFLAVATDIGTLTIILMERNLKVEKKVRFMVSCLWRMHATVEDTFLTYRLFYIFISELWDLRISSHYFGFAIEISLRTW